MGFGKKKKQSYSVVEGSENEYDEYADFYGSEQRDERCVVDDYGFDLPGYDEVYDEQGCSIPCDGYNCNANVKFHNGRYECPKCGKIFERASFFEYIGANPPGPMCVRCDNLYPGCIICPHGYPVDEY